MLRTLNTCRQFFPLSFNRLSSISMISIKSTLHGGTSQVLADDGSKSRRTEGRAHLLYERFAMSFISRVVGGSGSLLVDERTFFCVGEYPLVTFLHALTDFLPIEPPTMVARRTLRGGGTQCKMVKRVWWWLRAE